MQLNALQKCYVAGAYIIYLYQSLCSGLTIADKLGLIID